MAKVGYTLRSCETCGGPLEWHKDENEYVCSYCGNRYERSESYDGQFSVRHSAQQVLSAVAARNRERAEEGLNNCQMIDPYYTGTIIARMAYQLFEAGLAQAAGDGVASQGAISQAIALYRRLAPEFSESLCPDEADFYESMEDADARSLLISDFRMLRDTARSEYLGRSFDASAVHGGNAANDAIARAASLGDWGQFDSLVSSSAAYNADAALGHLLSGHPDGPAKIEALSRLLGRSVTRQSAREIASSYLLSSADGTDTKCAVVGCLLGAGVSVRGDVVGKLLVSRPDDEDSGRMLSNYCGASQIDEDVDALLDELLRQGTPRQVTAAVEVLSRSGSFVSFAHGPMSALLLRTDLTVDERLSCLAVASEHGLSQRRMQALLSDVLGAEMPSADVKCRVVGEIATRIGAVNPTLVESYLMQSTVDGTDKARLVECLIKHVPARSSLSYTARRYVSSSPDELSVREGVLAVLARVGLTEQPGYSSAVPGEAGKK